MKKILTLTALGLLAGLHFSYAGPVLTSIDKTQTTKDGAITKHYEINSDKQQELANVYERGIFVRATEIKDGQDYVKKLDDALAYIAANDPQSMFVQHTSLLAGEPTPPRTDLRPQVPAMRRLLNGGGN